jgi:hypothetical protein
MRDLLFKCPSCATSLTFDRKLAGKTLRCPSCKGPIAVPVPDASFSCPHCDAELHVPSGAEGEFECPACGKSVAIAPAAAEEGSTQHGPAGEPPEQGAGKPDDSLVFVCMPNGTIWRGHYCTECGAAHLGDGCPNCDKTTGTPEPAPFSDQTTDDGTHADEGDVLDYNSAWWFVRVQSLQMPEWDDRGPEQALSVYGEGVRAYANRDFRQAIVSYERAIEDDPGFPWSFNNLAWILATCPDKSLRNGSRAISLARAALCLAGRPYWGFVGTLAAAYAENGDFEKAVRLMEKAVDLAPPEKRERERQVLQSLRERQTMTDNDPPPGFQARDRPQSATM